MIHFWCVFSAQLFGARRPVELWSLKKWGCFSISWATLVINHGKEESQYLVTHPEMDAIWNWYKLMLYDAICYYLNMMLPCLITSWFCHVARPWLLPSAHLHLTSQRGRTEVAKDEEGAPTHDVWADRWTGRTWQWLGIWMLKPCIQGM